jgi:hypothetical protein
MQYELVEPIGLSAFLMALSAISCAVYYKDKCKYAVEGNILLVDLYEYETKLVHGFM